MAESRFSVGCAGILVSDTFCGPMAALPPEGQLMAVDDMPTSAGGCAANVAIDLAKQGVPVSISGCLGADNSAAVIQSSLVNAGVNCERLVAVQGLPTSKTVILLVAGEDRRYIHSFGANAAFRVDHIDRDWLKSLTVFYLGGLFIMPAFDPGEFRDVLEFCRQHGVTTVVDVVIPQTATFDERLPALMPFVDYFLPNDDEARLMTGQDDPLLQLKTLLGWGAGHVMITRGRLGVIAGSGDRFWESGVYSGLPMIDPSGSGDAFAAGVVNGILHGWDVPRMIRYASAMGASANTALGTTAGVFNSEQVKAFIASHPLEVRTGAL